MEATPVWRASELPLGSLFAQGLTGHGRKSSLRRKKEIATTSQPRNNFAWWKDNALQTHLGLKSRFTFGAKPYSSIVQWGPAVPPELLSWED